MSLGFLRPSRARKPTIALTLYGAFTNVSTVMLTNVLMPQLGESIAEGTIVRWNKRVGETVIRDETLFEISTDKVDAEIPSPSAGILAEILVTEGETVAVDSVVAVIHREGETLEPTGTPPPPPSEPGHSLPAVVESGAPATVKEPENPNERPFSRSSPLVRKMAHEHNIDLAAIAGTGTGGRVTKGDILASLERGGPRSAKIEPLSVMRRVIAERMVASQRTSAHVYTIFDVDFLRVNELRREKKASYEKAGAKLTYLAFIAKAIVDALGKTPVVNASFDGNNVVYESDVNLGIAVALEWGLIVPVIKCAQEKSLLEISLAISDVSARARAKRLDPNEVKGGTFTITNPGGLGSILGLPIINQPQVAILCVGAVEKRAVVVDDVVVARPRVFLTLGFDHRLLDGAIADEFMSNVKQGLEQFDSRLV